MNRRLLSYSFPALLGALCIYFLVAYLVIVAGTLFYPYQLEWLEGTTMNVVQRLSEGLPVYARPTIDYTALKYTPFYYYVADAFTWVVGMNIYAGRLVSLLSILAAAALLYQWARREGADRLLALAAPALLFASYRICGQWFHIARVDSLFLALTLAGLYCYACYTTIGSAILAGLLLAAAAYTKQQALLVAVPALLLDLWANPRRSLITLGVWGGVSVLLLFAYQYATDGWFLIYTFWTAYTDTMRLHKLSVFLQHDLQHYVAALALALVGLWLLWRYQGRRSLFYIGLFAGAVGSSALSRIHIGGYENVLMPLAAALSLVMVMGVTLLVRRRADGRNLCYALVSLQLAVLMYNPFSLMPTPANYEAGRVLMQYVASLPGDVLIPGMQFMQGALGKKSFYYRKRGWDDAATAEDLKPDHAQPSVDSQFKQAIARQQFSAIIVSKPNLDLLRMGKYYRLETTLPVSRYTVTGLGIMPKYVLVPRKLKEKHQ